MLVKPLVNLFLEEPIKNKYLLKFFDDNQYIQLYPKGTDYVYHGFLDKKEGNRYHYHLHGCVTNRNPLVIDFNQKRYAWVTEGSGIPIVDIDQGYFEINDKSHYPKLEKEKDYTCIPCAQKGINGAKQPKGLLMVVNPNGLK